MIDRPWLRVWPEGTPISIRYPEVPLFELLRNSARKYPRRSAIVYFGRSITFRELDIFTEKFATALSDMNVGKGDRVALLLPNIPEFVISYYGALKIGAIVTAINPVNEGGVEYQLRDSGAKTIVALDLLYSRLQARINKIDLENVVTTTATDSLPILHKLLAPLKGIKRYSTPNSWKFWSLIKKYEPETQKVTIKPKEDLAVLQYTSGTTGFPKGAMLTHFNLVTNAIQTYHWTRRWGCADKPLPSPVILCLIPFFHIYGMTVAMNEGMLSGSTLVLVPQLQLRDLVKAIIKHKPIYFPGVPMMYSFLLTNSEIKSEYFKSLHYCISGGAPIPIGVQKQFTDLTRSDLVEGYGLTEASPVTHCNPLEKEQRKQGSIGIPYPDTDAKIVDLETGEFDLAPNEVGELIVRGPQVMKGYWKKPEETKNTLRAGWLFTGDIAKMDEEGYFYILNRKSDVIISSGSRVFPTEVEKVITAHPAVKEVAVIGIQDPYRCATSIKAFIVAKRGYEEILTSADILRFCEENLDTNAIPSFIEFRKALPKTTRGELYRRVLREEEN